MRLYDIYKSRIDRPINGVIKVAQDDEESMRQELAEYVITRELRRHFSTFLTNYEHSLDVPTDKIGVWISGFFGSGKSHFLKMLSYLLSDRVVGGKRAISYFEDKLNDPMMFAQLERCAAVTTKTILFNIDSKSPINKDATAILRVFAKVFYEHLGFYGNDLKVARFEQFVSKQGKLEAFRERFAAIHGTAWEDARDAFAFWEDDVVEALCATVGVSETAARNWFNGEETAALTIEQLVSEIRDYVYALGRDARLLFMIDEVGQYIGADGSLMLNLQTIVEEIGAKCGGRVWVMVTSQEAIDTITKISGDDFSKIQGRFNTRLSLSSSSVDEVIKKRILAKTEGAEQALTLQFERSGAVLRNLFTFRGAVLDMKGYENAYDFVETYPFVPYQFRLMQNVLAQIRKHGNSGKHLSGGERSMLSGFQEAAKAIQDKDENALVPFYLFYNTIHTFLESTIRRVIDRCQRAAEAGDGLELYDVDVLKLLYESLLQQYGSKPYPDKALVGSGVQAVDTILQQRRDNTALLRKLLEQQDELLDVNEDIADVQAFFKNQRPVFDRAGELLKAMERERSYWETDSTMQDTLDRIGNILQMEKPYRRIAELPTLVQQAYNGYGTLLAAKRAEVCAELEAAEEELRRSATPEQAALTDRAGKALADKRRQAESLATLTELDALRVQIQTLLQQALKALATPADPKLNAVTINRGSVCRTVTLKTPEDIEAYTAAMREELLSLLDGHDAVYII